MDFNLVVVRAFGPYAIGDLISAPDDVDATLASSHADHVQRVAAPNRPGV